MDCTKKYHRHGRRQVVQGRGPLAATQPLLACAVIIIFTAGCAEPRERDEQDMREDTAMQMDTAIQGTPSFTH